MSTRPSFSLVCTETSSCLGLLCDVCGGDWNCGQRTPYASKRLGRARTRAARKQRLAAYAKLSEPRRLPSSDDEGRPKNLLNSEPNAAAVSLSRPSDIVPEPEYGSVSDAGLPPELRAVFRNRKRCTVLAFETLDEEGRRSIHCTDSDRFLPLNSQYSRSLRIPKEERDVQPCRAPRKLLSFYREKRKIRPGEVSKKPKQRLRSVKLSDGERVPVPEDTSCSSVYDFGGSTDESSGEESPVAGGRWGHRLVKVKPPPPGDPINEPEEDLLTDMLQANSERAGLAAAPSAEKEPAPGVNDGADETGDAVVAGEAEVLSPFQKSVMAGLTFTGDTSRIQVGANNQKTLVPAWKTLPTREVVEASFGDFEAHSKGFASKFMRKMGFNMGLNKGLGARGQGRENPLEGISRAGRSGLGTRRGGGGGVGESDEEGEDVSDGMAVLTDEVAKALQKTEDAVLHGKQKRKRGIADAGEAGISTTAENVYKSRRMQPTTHEVNLLQEDVDKARLGGNSRSRPSHVPDEDDDLESDDDLAKDDAFDNGRRALVIDFDALVQGSAFERREAAYRQALVNFECLAGKRAQNVANLLVADGRDLGDEEAARRIIGEYGVDVTDALCDELLDRVDGAFDKAEPLKIDTAILDALKPASQSLHIGILHRGTRKRMNRELSRAGLAHAFNTRKIVLFHSDSSPYTKSVKEILCHLGVSARQSLLLVHEQRSGYVPSFAISAKILGAHSLIRCASGKILGGDAMIRNLAHSLSSAVVEIDAEIDDKTVLAALVEDDDVRKFPFVTLLKTRAPVRRYRRVLALYSADCQYYAGRVEYEDVDSNRRRKKVLVRFYKWDNIEWVDSDEVFSLIRRHFDKLAAEGFIGLLDPDCDIL